MGLKISSKPPVMTLKKSVDSAEPRPAPRMAAEDRREQIIEVAVRLFSQRGFRGTTTKAIAVAAGVNEAIIFRHFSTKSELYAAIIDRKANSAAVKAMRSALAEAIEQSDDRRVFETLAFHMLEFHERDDTAMRLLLYRNDHRSSHEQEILSVRRGPDDAEHYEPPGGRGVHRPLPCVNDESRLRRRPPAA